MLNASVGGGAMQVTHAAEVRPAPETDERVAKTSRVRRLLVRPEIGALAGAIGVWIFFAIAAGDRGFLAAPGSRSPSSGGWASPPSPPGCCYEPRSATGSSVSAETSRQHATSACRS